MTYETIDDVIWRMDEIVEQCRREASCLGYFAALYRKVTIEVKQGIETGRFQDGARMERLDVVFATRYLDAYEQWQRGERPTEAWQLAFEQAHNPRLLVLQHLLLGMNAHINLDLGIAAARVCPGRKLPGLQKDFEEINRVLSSLMDDVQKGLGTISRLMRVIDFSVNYSDKFIANRRMRRARGGAWALAVQLAPLSLQEQVPFIVARDQWVRRRGEWVMRPTGLWPVLRTIAAVEKKNPVKVIESLC